MVGALLVAASAVGLYAAASRAGAGSRHSYVVLRNHVAIGTKLEAADLTLVRADLPRALRARAFDNPRVLVGATVIGPVEVGELLQAGSVLRTRNGAGDQQLSFAVDRSRVVTGLKEGERVDILVTYGTGAEAYTMAAVRQALVESVDRSKGSLSDRADVVLTISLGRSTDSLAVAHGARAGQLTVVRSTPATDVEPGPYRPPGGAASP